MKFSVSKKTRTYADTLQAIGLSHLLRELCGSTAEIVDAGSEFRITVEGAEPDKWDAPQPGFPYIWDSKNKKDVTAPNGEVLDYRREMEKRDAKRLASKVSRKAGKQVETALQAQDMPIREGPAAELDLATILASMRKGWDGDRQLFRWLREDRGRALNWTKYRLGTSTRTVDDPKWSNTQFLNPITGKGVHAPKTLARAPNAISSALSDPFEDWLKLRGVFRGMLAYRNGDDFKLFVIEPARTTVTAIERVAAGLRRLDLWGGVRLDIHALLRCTAELIARSDVMDGGPVLLRGRRPVDVIGGLRQAYFKSLGTAAALMNDALLPIPDWFAINTAAEASRMLDIIDEFIGPADRPGGCLGSLQEKNSDDCAILQVLRDWLTSGSLQDLVAFHAAFAGHLMQKRTRREWARPFSTENLTFLLSERYVMKDVVTNAGFLSIARAVRNATIYSVGDGAPSQLTTRFGLAQEWKQKLRAGKAEFLAAVADFVQQYNWEVVNRFNRRYHVVQTQDLDELTRLLDSDYGAEAVGLLLLAYGYAQAPKMEATSAAQGAH
jgi:hypothetical protein